MDRILITIYNGLEVVHIEERLTIRRHKLSLWSGFSTTMFKHMNISMRYWARTQQISYLFGEIRVICRYCFNQDWLNF